MLTKKLTLIKYIFNAPSATEKIARFGLLWNLWRDRIRTIVNLVTPLEDFNVKGDGKQTKNVIGFNIDNIFTLGDAKKKPDGSPDSLDYKDYCVDFTLRHRGNEFVTDNFVQAKAPAKKQFAQVAAHNIVSQLVNVEQGLDCECQVTSPFSAENVCKVVYTKERTVESKRGGQKG